MVAIADFSLLLLRRRRRRQRRKLLARLVTGEDHVALGPALLRFVRVLRDIRNEMRRVEAVRVASSNLGSFTTEQAMSLFRFRPSDVGHIADLLGLDNVTFPGTQRVSSVERLCILSRRLSSPTRWVDLEELFGRSSPSFCSIFYETVEAVLETVL